MKFALIINGNSYDIGTVVIDFDNNFFWKCNPENFAITSGSSQNPVKFIGSAIDLLKSAYNENSENHVQLKVDDYNGYTSYLLLDFEGGVEIGEITSDGDKTLYFQTNLIPLNNVYSEVKRKFEEGLTVGVSDVRRLYQSKVAIAPEVVLTSENDVVMRMELGVSPQIAEVAPSSFAESDYDSTVQELWCVFNDFEQSDVPGGITMMCSDYFAGAGNISFSYDAQITNNEYVNLELKIKAKCEDFWTRSNMGLSAVCDFRINRYIRYLFDDGTSSVVTTQIYDGQNLNNSHLLDTQLCDYNSIGSGVNFCSAIPYDHIAGKVIISARVFFRVGFYIQRLGALPSTHQFYYLIAKKMVVTLQLNKMVYNNVRCNAVPLSVFCSLAGINNRTTLGDKIYITTPTINREKAGLLKGKIDNIFQDLFYLCGIFTTITDGEVVLRHLSEIGNFPEINISHFYDYCEEQGEQYNRIKIGSSNGSAPFQEWECTSKNSINIEEKSLPVVGGYTDMDAIQMSKDKEGNSLCWLYAYYRDLNPSNWDTVNMMFNNVQRMNILKEYIYSFLRKKERLIVRDSGGQEVSSVANFATFIPQNVFSIFDKKRAKFKFCLPGFNLFDYSTPMKIKIKDTYYFPISLEITESPDTFECECLIYK